MTVKEKEKILENKGKKKEKKEIQRFHTGDWILDCIMSNGESSNKGFPIGKIIHLWGGSRSGKSFLCLNAIREMLAIYGLDGAEYLWLDVEQAFSFDVENLFGFSIVDNKHIAHPKTVSQWQATIETFAQSTDPKKPKIMVLDSLDTLTTIEELERKNSRVKEFKKSKGEDTGKQNTYGMEKAKRIGEVYRTCLDTVEKNNIAMFIISQERSNVNKKTVFDKDTTVSGGKAKDYYASIQMSVKEVDSFGDKYRQVGACVQIIGEKTRTPYEGRRSFVNIYYNLGFDPISSGIDFLYDLKDDYGKLATDKIHTLKWAEEFDLNNMCGEEITDKQVKEFAKENDIEDDVRQEYGRLTAKNIRTFVSLDNDLLSDFVEKFGVMSRDNLISWIEEDENRQKELEKRVKQKFYYLEEKATPKRKSRKLQ